MITYKDMTFCEEKDCLKWAHCPKALTDKVKAGNKTGLPYSMFMEQPSCYLSRKFKVEKTKTGS